MKYPAHLITAARIVFALLLTGTQPFSAVFFCLYAAAGISDMLDGFIARRTGTCSKSGEILDSVADIAFIAAVLVKLIPVLPVTLPMALCAAGIAAVRICTFCIGYAKYRAVPFVHTYANKAAGFGLFVLPFVYPFTGLAVPGWIVCGIAAAASAEELIITLRRPELNRNAKSLMRIDIKKTAAALKTDIPAVFIALKKKETPLAAKICAAVTICYALSPVDLIPDFIPVLGYIDDLIILPLLVMLTVRFIPPAVFAECRAESAGLWNGGKPKRWYYALPIVLVWCAAAVLITGCFLRMFAD